jgi:outer membrane protein
MKTCLKILLILWAAAPGFAQAPRILDLGLKEAVDLALSPDGNTRIRIAEEMIRQAEARSAQTRAALLPNVDASVSTQNLTRNLAVFGIGFNLPIPGFSFPRLVGPFNVFDARATMTQSVFDLSAIRRYQSSRAALSQAEAEKENAQDQVRARVAQAYLAALRALAGLETAQSNVELSEATLKLVNNQKNAGTGTGIEVARARVQLANAKQTLLVSENEFHKARLQLLRAIGLELGAGIRLTERLAFLPVRPVGFEEALRTALESRADWKAEQKRLESVDLNRKAVGAERIPSVGAFGDYGTTGIGVDNSIPTRVYGIAVRIPIFDGGRRDARRAESASLFRQEQEQVRDLRAQIELEIRLALDTLLSAEAQVKVAEEGLTLAQDELAHSQRRYESGVASSIEVTDAQTRLERARENRIVALFNYSRARLDLGTATGTIAQMIQ